jgi:hypothetical protein
MTNEHASSPALSATFSSAKASPSPMVLAGFILFEFSMAGKWLEV